MSKFINFVKHQIYILRSKLWFKLAAYCVVATLAIYFLKLDCILKVLNS